MNAPSTPRNEADTASALIPGTRLRLLRLLFEHPDDDHSISELIEALNSGRGGVQREVERLLKCGLISQQRRGRRKRYRIATTHALAPALAQVVVGSSQPTSPPHFEATQPQAEANPPQAGAPAADDEIHMAQLAQRLQSLSPRSQLCALLEAMDSNHAATAVIISDELDEAVARATIGGGCNVQLLSRQMFLDRLQHGDALAERTARGPHLALYRNGASCAVSVDSTPSVS